MKGPCACYRMISFGPECLVDCSSDTSISREAGLELSATAQRLFCDLHDLWWSFSKGVALYFEAPKIMQRQ